MKRTLPFNINEVVDNLLIAYHLGLHGVHPHWFGHEVVLISIFS